MQLPVVVGLTALPLLPAPSGDVACLRDPVFGDDLLVVFAFEGDEAAALWAVDEESLEEVRSDADEVLEPGTFGARIVRPGDPDPTRDGFRELGEGRCLLVFELEAAERPVRSIPRFAGTYELLHGGEERWVDVPFEKLADADDWEDDDLEEAGFTLTQGVRAISQVHVRLKGEVFDVNDVELFAVGDDEGLMTHGATFDSDQVEYQFDLPEEQDVELVVRVSLSDGSTVELGDLPLRDAYRPVDSDELEAVDVELEVRSAIQHEAHAEGEGDYDLLRGFRWVDKRGDVLDDIWPSSQSSGFGTSVEMSCRVPTDLPRGAKLQLGVLVDAAWETISFEETDVPGPDA